MKEYSGKTLEEALEEASKESGLDPKDLVYKVTEEKKGLFSKKVTIEVSDINDAMEYAEDYLRQAVGGMGVDLEFAETIEEDVIRIILNSPRNPILIGKNGRTLQALNELTKLAVSNRFHHRYRILFLPHLQRQNTGHDLGGAGHGPRRISILFIQNPSRVPIHKYRRLGVQLWLFVLLRRRCAGDGAGKHRRRQNQRQKLPDPPPASA